MLKIGVLGVAAAASVGMENPETAELSGLPNRQQVILSKNRKYTSAIPDICLAYIKGEIDGTEVVKLLGAVQSNVSIEIRYLLPETVCGLEDYIKLSPEEIFNNTEIQRLDAVNTDLNKRIEGIELERERLRSLLTGCFAVLEKLGDGKIHLDDYRENIEQMFIEVKKIVEEVLLVQQSKDEDTEKKLKESDPNIARRNESGQLIGYDTESAIAINSAGMQIKRTKSKIRNIILLAKKVKDIQLITSNKILTDKEKASLQLLANEITKYRKKPPIYNLAFQEIYLRTQISDNEAKIEELNTENEALEQNRLWRLMQGIRGILSASQAVLNG